MGKHTIYHREECSPGKQPGRGWPPGYLALGCRKRDRRLQQRPVRRCQHHAAGKAKHSIEQGPVPQPANDHQRCSGRGQCKGSYPRNQGLQRRCQFSQAL